MIRRFPVSLAALAVGCVAPDFEAHPPAPTQTSAQNLLNGRPSGADENVSVRVIVGHPKVHACTGTLIGPNVALTARHCVLRSTSSDVPSCTADGNPLGLGQDLTNVSADVIDVFYGESKTNATFATGRALFVPDALTVCKADIALIVLDKPLAERYAAVRFAMPQKGAKFRVSGWGYTSSSLTKLPDVRTSLDDLPVNEVGPGLIPANTFAIAGGTLCFGDSGVGAREGDAVFGLYSRIEGQVCDVSVARNVFMSLAPHRLLFDRAFAEAGAVLWVDGTPAPWAPAAPACDGAGGGGQGGEGGCAPVTLPNECAGGACDAPAPTMPTAASSGCTLVPALSGAGTGEGQRWIVMIALLMVPRLTRRA